MIFFFALQNLYLCISFNIIDISDTTTFKLIHKNKTINIFENMQIIYKFAENL